MGQVVTFYSYKGGVGRTMALANIATLLAQWGYKTLLVDWDLEAPGLEFYFQEFIDVEAIAQQEGLVDLLAAAERGTNESIAGSVAWDDAIVSIEIPDAIENIHLITAGQRDKSGSYFDTVTNLDWDSFYKHEGGFLIEKLRSQWKEKYDYVLIDSRTGITDIGGICTIQLPDILVLLFTATDQSLNGIVDVAAKAQTAHWDLPFDRTGLTCLPVPSRFDSNEEFSISRQWLERFSRDLEEIYSDWLPRSINRKHFLEVTKIPYSSYFSFGEKLPVREQGTTDPAGLGYAYENLAAIIASEFKSVADLLVNRDQLIAKQSIRKSEIRIFIAHSGKDSHFAKELYDRLQEQGYTPWLAVEDLLPGQNWRLSIHRAIEESDIFLACFSSNTHNDKSYIHSEIKFALNEYVKRSRRVYLIPVRLDNSVIPDLTFGEHDLNLMDFQWLDYREENGFEKLVKSIEHFHVPTITSAMKQI